LSHFAVLVIGENVEEQMLPFCEHKNTKVGDKYFAFIDCTEKLREEWKQKKLHCWYPLADIHGDEKIFESLHNGLEVEIDISSNTSLPPPENNRSRYRIYHTDKQCNIEIYVQVSSFDENKMTVVKTDPPLLIPVSKCYGSFEQFVDDFYDFVCIDGKYGYYANPNAKWDGYSIGGRYSGFFRCKESFGKTTGKMYYNSLLKKDIDFDFMIEEVREKAEKEFDEFMYQFKDIEIPNYTLRSYAEKHGKNWYENINETEYYKKLTMLTSENHKYSSGWQWTDDIRAHFFQFDRNVFVQRAIDEAFVTFAVIKDGNWYERGTTGWWGTTIGGMDTETWNSEFFKLFNSLDDNDRLTIIDCHI